MTGLRPAAAVGRGVALVALFTLLTSGCSRQPEVSEGAAVQAPVGDETGAKTSKPRRVDKGPKDCTACMDTLCREACWPGEDAEIKPGLMDCPSCMMMNCQDLCWPSKKKKE